MKGLRVYVEQEIVSGQKVSYRPGASDERVINEVVVRAAYRRKRIGFDVQRGERWLDLGANIGAFAIYCLTRGALAEDCYEPDDACFDLLERNARGSNCHHLAVTNQKQMELPFWKGRDAKDFYRQTAIPSRGLPEHGKLANIHGRFLKNLKYDGVKMDIEGSEGGLIDEWLLPSCEKLCMEYHLSRDPSIKNLERRIYMLQSHFQNVNYPPEFDRLIASGGEAKTFFDRNIFCWGAR